MGSIFGSSDQEVTQNTNPYKGLPDWAIEYYQRDIDRGEGLIDSAGAIAEDRAANPEQIVGMHPDEIAAIEAMMGENAQAQGLMDRATGMVGGDQYMSPYTDQVVDTTLANMDRENMRQQAQRGASMASIGGLNGTRGAVADALSDQLHGMNRAEMEARLRDDAFRFGSEMGLQGSQRLQGVAEGGMGLQGMASQWQGTGGETARGIEQRREDNVMDTLTWYNDMFNSSRQLPSTMGGQTQSTEPGPSVASQALGLGASAAGIWSALGGGGGAGIGASLASLPFISDERAKTDIEEEDDALGKLKDLGAYSYEYKPGLGQRAGRTSGLMAQDLERAGITGAVEEGPDGLKRVNPYPVLATVVQAVRELDQRTAV